MLMVESSDPELSGDPDDCVRVGPRNAAWVSSSFDFVGQFCTGAMCE